MKRRHLVELGDLTWWPRTFRDAATDYLVTAVRRSKVYDGLVHRLAAVERTVAERITDLGSDGGRSRLFWTYLVPVLPVAILFDSVVSILRTYTPEEMLAMGRKAGRDEYEWEAGSERPSGSPIPVPFLVGVPRGLS